MEEEGRTKDFREIDGGMSSRKFLLALSTQILLVVVALLTEKIPALVPLYATIAGSLVGVLAVYSGGNVATRWVHRDEGDASTKAGTTP